MISLSSSSSVISAFVSFFPFFFLIFFFFSGIFSSEFDDSSLSPRTRSFFFSDFLLSIDLDCLLGFSSFTSSVFFVFMLLFFSFSALSTYLSVELILRRPQDRCTEFSLSFLGSSLKSQ